MIIYIPKLTIYQIKYKLNFTLLLDFPKRTTVTVDNTAEFYRNINV